MFKADYSQMRDRNHPIPSSDPATAELYAEVDATEVADYQPPSAAELRKDMSLPRLAFKAVLLQAGLLEQAGQLIQASGDPLSMLKWAEAIEFPRTDPLIDSLGSQLGLSPEQIDELYAQGAALI